MTTYSATGQMPAAADEEIRPSQSGFQLGLLPLVIALPLLYWPQVVESDTQPWVTAGVLASFFVFWPRGYKLELWRTGLPVILAIACAIIYLLREPDGDLVFRFLAILVTFVALWAVLSRGGQGTIAVGFKITIGLWFLVGLYQMIAIRLGLPVEFFGRFVAMRSGVPSLTAEPSFYGSMSVLQLMYLLNLNDHRRNAPFMAMAVMSVFLSGSILSYLFLLIPLGRLPKRFLFTGGIALFLLFAQGVRVGGARSANRIVGLTEDGLLENPLRIVESDPSTNLRVGHVVFTLVDEFPQLVLFQTNNSFRRAYNSWAFEKRTFIYNQSDFILTSLGELIFRAGAAGLLLALSLFYYALRSVKGSYWKLEKAAMMLVCFASPIGPANPFFVAYILQRQDDRGN